MRANTAKADRAHNATKRLMLVPAFLFFAGFTIFPLIFTGYVSLSSWNVGGEHSFIGLGN
jgi:ABC-type sugar transport system permease subunit